MKKLTIFLIFFSGCFGCECPDPLPYWNISDFETKLFDLEFNPVTNGNIAGDSIYIITLFAIEYVDNPVITLCLIQVDPQKE